MADREIKVGNNWTKWDDLVAEWNWKKDLDNFAFWHYSGYEWKTEYFKDLWEKELEKHGITNKN